MFHIDYAILTEGPYPVVNDKTLIAISGILDQDETYTLSIVTPGFFTPRGGLIISGKSIEQNGPNGLDLPCIELLLADIPDDVLEDIAANGASIIDARSEIRLEFDTEVATIA